MENTYVARQNNNGTITLTPAGQVIQQGTSMSAENFNNMECGILDADLANRLLLLLTRNNATEIAKIKTSTGQAVGVVTYMNGAQTGSIEAAEPLMIEAGNGIGATVQNGRVILGVDVTTAPESMKGGSNFIADTVTLETAKWTQTTADGLMYEMPFEGVLADPTKCLVFCAVVPNDAAMEAEWARCDIRCVTQGDGYIRFRSRSGETPTIDINVSVAVFTK
ncbi:MAG: hypothetical protein IJX94_01335 [Clostridia bacterium]|nr:hypothetical protein [Clostridia bacterium]